MFFAFCAHNGITLGHFWPFIQSFRFIRESGSDLEGEGQRAGTGCRYLGSRARDKIHLFALR